MLKTKEQGKNPQDQTNEEEIGNLPEKEFTVMTVKISKISKIEWRKHIKRFNKDLEELKNKQC